MIPLVSSSRLRHDVETENDEEEEEADEEEEENEEEEDEEEEGEEGDEECSGYMYSPVISC